MVKNDMEQVKGFKMDLQFFAEPGPEPGTPPTNEGNPVATELVQAGNPPTNQPNDPQAMLAGMNKAMREAAELRKQVEAYQKYGDPEVIGQNLERLRGIDENPQAAIEAFVTQNPQIFNALAQKMGPQAAFQAIGNQLFSQPQTDPYQKYRDVYEQTGDVGKLVEAIYTDVESNVDKKIEQKLRPIAAANQSFQDFADKTKLEIYLSNFVKANPDLGVTKEQIIDVIEKEQGSRRIPYSLVLNDPDIRDLAIIKAQGGLIKYGESIRNEVTQKLTQQVNNKQLSNNQNVAIVTPSGGVNTNVIPEPLTDPDKRFAEARRLANLTP